MIIEFKGENRWLSNFWLCQFQIRDTTFWSAEHAYMCAKANNIDDYIAIRDMPTPGKAKRFASTIALVPWWEHIKFDVMLNVLRAKFGPNELGNELMCTGDIYLSEGNSWGDTVWGVDEKLGGRNWLGSLLMLRRAELRSGVDVTMDAQYWPWA